MSDEIVVEEFMESPYNQAFRGHEMFVTDEAVMDPSLLSKQRKRLGKEFFEKFETEVLNVLVENKIIRPKDHMLDATVLPANIEYPTGVKWVNGFCFLDRFTCNAYNETDHAETCLKKYEERFGKLPKVSIGDGIFGNRTNRQKLKSWESRTRSSRWGGLWRGPRQKPWMKRKLKLRNGHMEGIIGHVKNTWVGSNQLPDRRRRGEPDADGARGE